MEDALAQQEAEARAAGKIGYIGRCMVQTTLPHSKLEITEYERHNGTAHLYVKAPRSIGLPYGMLPRLLLVWMTTEVVLTGERELALGRNMSSFFERIGIFVSGGPRGYIRPMRDQMIRLFNCDIRFRIEDENRDRGSLLAVEDYDVWWLQPRQHSQDDLFPSSITLTTRFFEHLFNHCIPIDLRTIAVLRKSPLAFDLYIWLTYRFSYLAKQTEVPWEALAYQLGSNYEDLRFFKRRVLVVLKDVLVEYKQAKVEEGKYGLVLRPSPTHIPMTKTRAIKPVDDATYETWMSRHPRQAKIFYRELEQMKLAAEGTVCTDDAWQGRIHRAALRAGVPLGVAYALTIEK